MRHTSALHAIFACDHSNKTKVLLFITGAGAGGKHHSAVVTNNGESYTFGSNLHGQCGTGSIKSKEKAEGQTPLHMLAV